MHLKTIKKLFIAAASLCLTANANASGVGNLEEPVELLVKFIIAGTPNQDGTFTIGGPGYSTITTSSGVILDDVIPGLKIADLSDAKISFGDFSEQFVPFTCAKNSCTITIGGSTFTSDAGAPLDGRLARAWGPIVNSDFNPPSSTPLRIFGCGGLVETSGEGDYAGMVGSICFNGVFNVPDFSDMNTPPTLTGGSNCTITLHTPIVQIP